jgi:uncharacterized protein (DUF3820 family)
MQFFFQPRDHAETTTEEALDYALGFGKNRGVTLRTLCLTYDGRAYLKYILSNDPQPMLRSYVDQALKCTPDVKCTLQDAGDLTMPYGKFRGMLLREIVASEGGMNYLDWASRWDKCKNATLIDSISIIKEEYQRQNPAVRAVQ